MTPSSGKKAFAEVVPDSHGRWAVQIEGVHYLVGQSYKNKEEAKEHAGEINKAVSAAVRAFAEKAMKLCDRSTAACIRDLLSQESPR